MSTALEVAKPATPATTARPPAGLGRPQPPALARRLGTQWLDRAAWSIGRTGRPGLVGMALLLASALFLVSTHLKVVAEVEMLRTELATAQQQERTPAVDRSADPGVTLRALPARADMPGVLRQLFDGAARARLSVDTARYEVTALKSSGLLRYQVAFPVSGPYPRIRAFIDETLATMPEVALSDLALERKSIGDGDVDARIRLTVFARSAP